jgi:hypothetical protein
MLKTLKDGRQFDPASCVRFEENFVFPDGVKTSMATGDSTSHEALYYLGYGLVRWIVESWTDPLDESEYEQVGERRAYEWLITNDCVPDEEFMQLPRALQHKLVGLQAERVAELLDDGPTMNDGIMPRMPSTRSEWDG